MPQAEQPSTRLHGILTADQILALESMFGWLYATPHEIGQVCRRAGIRPPAPPTDATPRDIWRDVIEGAAGRGAEAVRRLLRAAQSDYPDDVALKAFLTLLDYVEEYGTDAVQRRAPQSPVPPRDVPQAGASGSNAPGEHAGAPGGTVPGRGLPRNRSPHPVSKPPPSPRPHRTPTTRLLTAFYVFAQADEARARILEQHLQRMQQEGYFSRWAHRRVSDPAHWQQKLSHNLEEADIVVFLVSDALLQSGYLADVEATWALEMHGRGQARLVPVRLDESSWEGTTLAGLSPVPGDPHPLPDWSSLEAWAPVVQQIRQHAETLRYR